MAFHYRNWISIFKLFVRFVCFYLLTRSEQAKLWVIHVTSVNSIGYFYWIWSLSDFKIGRYLTFDCSWRVRDWKRGHAFYLCISVPLCRVCSHSFPSLRFTLLLKGVNLLKSHQLLYSRPHETWKLFHRRRIWIPWTKSAAEPSSSHHTSSAFESCQT